MLNSGQTLSAERAQRFSAVRTQARTLRFTIRLLTPYLLFAMGLIAYCLPLLRVLSGHGDEAEFVNFAVRIGQGQLPYRDFFTASVPGTYLLLASYFKVLGTSWLTTRVYLLVTVLAATSCLFWLARRLGCGNGLGPVILFLASAYNLWGAVSAHMDSIAAGLAAFAVLLEAIRRRNLMLLVAAGAGAGLTTCLMQQKGMLLFAAFTLIVGLEWRSIRAWFPLCAGYLAVLSGGAAWLWAHGILGVAIADVFFWPLHHYSRVNQVPYGFGLKEVHWDAWIRSLVPLLSPLPGYAISTLITFPLLVIAALPVILAGLVWRFGKGAFTKELLPFWIAGSALFLAEMHRKDFNHVVYGSPLLILVGYYLWLRLQSRGSRLALQVVTICATVVLAIDPAAAMLSNHRIETRRGSVYSMGSMDPILSFLLSHTHPGEAVWIYPYSSMYHFLTATENPTSFTTLIYGYNTPEQFAEAMHDISRKRVRYVVWDSQFAERVRFTFPGYRVPSDVRDTVEAYLPAHYSRLIKTDWGFELLERNPDASTTNSNRSSR